MGFPITGFNAVVLLFMDTHQMNIYKTRIKGLDGWKGRINRQTQSIEKTLHDVFVEIGRRLNFCISLEGNTFEQCS